LYRDARNISVERIKTTNASTTNSQIMVEDGVGTGIGNPSFTKGYEFTI